MTERHVRQSFLGPHSEEILAHTEVTIVGLCGGGSHLAQQLAHIGVGRFNLVDFDRADVSNSNRMVGLDAAAAERKDRKVDVIRERILAIQPGAQVAIFAAAWQEVSDSLKFSDVIFGAVDSYRARDELERFARRFLIPYLDLGMDVHGDQVPYTITGQVILSVPEGPCLRCFGFITEHRLTEEAQRYGAAGGRPQVIWPNGTLASTAVGKFMQLVTPWSPERPALYTEYDGNRLTLMPSRKLQALHGHRCPHFDDPLALGDVIWGQAHRPAPASTP